MIRCLSVLAIGSKGEHLNASSYKCYYEQCHRYHLWHFHCVILGKCNAMANAMIGIDIVGGMKKIFNKIVGDEGEEKDEE